MSMMINKTFSSPEVLGPVLEIYENLESLKNLDKLSLQGQASVLLDLIYLGQGRPLIATFTMLFRSLVSSSFKQWVDSNGSIPVHETFEKLVCTHLPSYLDGNKPSDVLK